MGLYTSLNASSARVIALVTGLAGYAIASSWRPSGFFFLAAGIVLFFGVGDEVSATSTHDILPTLGFFFLLVIGAGMWANGY